MSVPFFDLSRQFAAMELELRAAVDSVLEKQDFIMGGAVAELELAVLGRTMADEAIACASGTDALLLPLKGLHAEPGDEVIVPSFTFFATAGAVANAGLKPVFCDVDPDTFCMTAELAEAVWTDRTRAIIPVHLFGQMADMGPIMTLADRRDAVVIEDVAQAMGARQGARAEAGSIGHAGSFSFFPTKNLGGFGDGGLITARSGPLADHVRLARTHGGRRMYDHEFVGTNSRLDTLQAAVLLAKLRYLDGWLEARRTHAGVYGQALEGLEGIRPPRTGAGNFHTWNQYTVVVDRRDELADYLSARSIGSKVYYPQPLHLQNCFGHLGGREGQLPISEMLCRQVLSIPIFPELREDEVLRVSEAITEFHA